MRGLWGYTLIEVAICLLIAGMLAGIASVSLKGASSSVTMEDLVAKIKHMDGYARMRASITGRGHWIELDVRQSRVRLLDPLPQGPTAILEFALPANVTLAGWVEQPDFPSDSDDQLRVAITPQGVSASYAVGFFPSSPGEERWIVFAGMTGQSHVERKGASHAKHRLMLLRQARDDAH